MYIYSHKVEEVKLITNQKRSDMCWLFACLNGIPKSKLHEYARL